MSDEDYKKLASGLAKSKEKSVNRLDMMENAVSVATDRMLAQRQSLVERELRQKESFSMDEFFVDVFFVIAFTPIFGAALKAGVDYLTRGSGIWIRHGAISSRFRKKKEAQQDFWAFLGSNSTSRDKMHKELKQLDFLADAQRTHADVRVKELLGGRSYIANRNAIIDSITEVAPGAAKKIFSDRGRRRPYITTHDPSKAVRFAFDTYRDLEMKALNQALDPLIDGAKRKAIPSEFMPLYLSLVQKPIMTDDSLNNDATLREKFRSSFETMMWILYIGNPRQILPSKARSFKPAVKRGVKYNETTFSLFADRNRKLRWAIEYWLNELIPPSSVDAETYVQRQQSTITRVVKKVGEQFYDPLKQAELPRTQYKSLKELSREGVLDFLLNQLYKDFVYLNDAWVQNQGSAHAQIKSLFSSAALKQK